MGKLPPFSFSQTLISHLAILHIHTRLFIHWIFQNISNEKWLQMAPRISKSRQQNQCDLEGEGSGGSRHRCPWLCFVCRLLCDHGQVTFLIWISMFSSPKWGQGFLNTRSWRAAGLAASELPGELMKSPDSWAPCTGEYIFQRLTVFSKELVGIWFGITLNLQSNLGIIVF